MAEQQKTLTVATLPKVLATERDKLNKARKDALAFLRRPHGLEETQKTENWFRDYEIDLLEVREFIDSDPLGLSEKDAEKYGKECERLSEQSVILGDRLAKEVKELEQKDKNSEFNLAGFLTITIAAPALLYSTIKARGDEFSKVANIAQQALIVFGVGYHFRDNLKKGWKEAANDLSPRELRNSASFMLYYAKESIAESDLSPQNIKASAGILAYYVKETTIENMRTVHNVLSKQASRIKPVRKMLERRKGRDQKSDLF